MLGHERLSGAGTESDALHIAMAVGVNARVETGRRVVARRGGAGGGYAQHLAAQYGGALRNGAVVIVAGGDVQISVGPEAQPTATVRTGTAVRVTGILERDIGNDVGAATRTAQVGAKHESDHTIGAWCGGR